MVFGCLFFEKVKKTCLFTVKFYSASSCIFNVKTHVFFQKQNEMYKKIQKACVFTLKIHDVQVEKSSFLRRVLAVCYLLMLRMLLKAPFWGNILVFGILFGPSLSPPPVPPPGGRRPPSRTSPAAWHHFASDASICLASTLPYDGVPASICNSVSVLYYCM